MRWVYSGQTCGEILSIYVYHDEMEDRYGLLLDLIPFQLMAPPFQSRVARPYLVWDVWFSIHLLLEGIGHIQIYGL
jgi:hypothetical protein